MRVTMMVAYAMGFQDGAVQITYLAAVLGVIGALTATIGNTAAYPQTNIKRLLAWSSIAHAGYMLCAVSLLVAHGSEIVEGGVNLPIQAILIYIAVYMFMNLGAFLVAAIVARETGSEELHEYSGLRRRSPALALAMAVFMFSLVGLPPFAGFAAKFNLMWVLGANGGWWWALVAVIAVNTVFSLYYYARVIRAMYLDDSGKTEFQRQPSRHGACASACAIVLLVMMIGFYPFTSMTGSASRMLVSDDRIRASSR